MIKRLLFVLFIVLCISVSLQAQVRCGFIGGLNISKVSSDENTIPNLSGSTLGSFGAVFDITLTRDLSMYLAPAYIEKGAGFAVDYPAEVSANLNMSFFELPVLIKYSFGEIIRPYLFTGPTFALNIASNIETQVMGFSMEVDAQDMTNSFELGVTIGSGISYVTDAVTLFLEGRYSVGLTDISNSGNSSVSFFGEEIEDVPLELPELNTSGLQLLIGFSLPFNGVN